MTEQQRFDRIAKEFGQGFKEAAENAQRWANAAAEQGNKGIGQIMQKYADKAAAVANDLHSPLIDSGKKIADMTREAD